MKNRIIALVVGMVLLLFSSLFAQITFERWYGGSEDDWGSSVLETPDNCYLIAGYTGSYGAGFSDVYLIKTDSFGDTIWAKTYGGSSFDIARDIIETADGGYLITGSTSSFGVASNDVYIIKTDSLGDTIFTRTFGGIDIDNGYSCVETHEGGYIVVGATASFGPGMMNIYLVKTDTLGNSQWEKTYGTVDWDAGYSIVQTPDSSYMVTGAIYSFSTNSNDVYLMKVNSVGDTLWTTTYGDTGLDVGCSLLNTFDGAYIIAGYTESVDPIWGDVYLIKADLNGDTLWTNSFGGIDWDMGYSVAQTSDGGYIVTGDTYCHNGNTWSWDVYLIKTDSVGDSLWTRTFGGNDDEYGRSVTVTSDGGFIITGTTRSFGAGNSDVYLIKADSLGNVGIQEQSDRRPTTTEKRLTCFPNPFTSVISLQLLGDCEGKESILTIFNASGRLVKSVKLETSTYQLGADLVPGIYFLKLNGTPVGKVVKVR